MTLQLDPSTDSSPVGDDQTTFATVILVGQTQAGVPVALLGSGASTTSDATGRFNLTVST